MAACSCLVVLRRMASRGLGWNFLYNSCRLERLPFAPRVMNGNRLWSRDRKKAKGWLSSPSWLVVWDKAGGTREGMWQSCLGRRNEFFPEPYFPELL